MNPLEQRWLDEARRTKRCPECDAPVENRGPSDYCSRWCVEMAWRRANYVALTGHPGDTRDGK